MPDNNMQESVLLICVRCLQTLRVRVGVDGHSIYALDRDTKAP
jgi:hypothetical protein